MKSIPTAMKSILGAGAMLFLAHSSLAMSVYWSEGVYVIEKTGDSDTDFRVYGGTGASSNPSAPGVGITVRGTLTTSLYPPSVFAYTVDVSAQPVWSPYPGAGSNRGETIRVSVYMTPPQTATFTNTVGVVSAVGPTYPGTTSHTATVTVTP